MQIQINGAQREFAQSSIALSELIEKLSLAPQRIAIEVNGQIIRRADWESTDINDGDRVEIVQFVGGGNVRQQ
ncbi:MAG TPA: sulfur carrier protein ThiS [Pyrinomonadaceae bacterium]|nr:sulfur carrier protein ThiS [Pyrinomonadaceae bacterium]